MKKTFKASWKKTAAVAFAAVTALSLFGCSSGSGNAPASTAAAGSEAAGSEAAKEPAEVTTVKVGVVGEYNAQWDTINELLKDWFAQIGLRLIDFKLEFGFDKDGKIILADEFSPDNCRLWDAEGHHMDKDVFRRDLGSLTDVYEVVLEKLQGLK